MDFSKITSVLSDHPYITAGAVVLGLFIFTRGGGSSNAAGAQDMSASIASMQIASDTNVALAGIQAQRDGIALGVQRDMALGAMDYAKSDRQASVLMAVQSMESSRMTTENNLSTGLAAFQSALGFTAAKKDLENQRASLDAMTALGFADIESNRATTMAGIYSDRDTSMASIFSDRALGLSSISSNRELGMFSLGTDRQLGAASLTNARDLGIAEINANVDLGKYDLDTERLNINTSADVTKYSLPFGERMQLQEQETIRNLAWRQKQIAKINANADIFGGLIGTAGNLLSQGMSMQMGGR